LAASRLTNGPAPILKEGIALAGGDAQNASANAATIIVKPSRVG